MNKELFKALVVKLTNQDNINALAEVLSESEIFYSEEFNNIIALLVGTYTVPVIKESATAFNGETVNLTFKSFNKVKMRVRYNYQRVVKTLEHNGEFLNKWEAERRGLAEEFKASAVDCVSDDVSTDCCSYEVWAKYQYGKDVVID